MCGNIRMVASRRGIVLWITVSAGIAIAAALVGFLFMPSLSGKVIEEADAGYRELYGGGPADKWIREMSDESWKSSSSFSKSDIFLN